MNRVDLAPKKLARLEYLSGDFVVLEPGDYVLCAATGKQIPLTDLRYWDPATQEAFSTAELAFKHVEARKQGSAEATS